MKQPPGTSPSSSTASSFYWFDYETFGTHPGWDRPCQFAGVRTDTELNVIGEPLVIFCRQSQDYLPHPAACRVTGITPQQANKQGLCESDFIKRIVREIGFPGTCSVGYNSIRFDDEFTRHTLFRNLLDPYEQEWKDGNSRWDLLDVVRLTRALRPQGINWPVNDDGSASNRLEHLSVANGIEHTQAHDAMSDVWATIGMAKVIKQAQPRLFDYAYANRRKAQVSQILNTRKRQPCLQVSGMIPGARHHISAILPLAPLPNNPNSIVVLDLHQDPRYLETIEAEELSRRLYLPAGQHSDSDAPRPGLRTVQINKCPVLVPLSTLRAEDADRLGMNINSITHHAQLAQQLLNDSLIAMISSVMTRQWDKQEQIDEDGTLYAGAFLSQSDKQRLAAIHKAEVTKLHHHAGHFDDHRLNEMLWRYQARNYPESLNAEQTERWMEHCNTRLNDAAGPWLTFAEYQQAIDEIDWRADEQKLMIALRDYGIELKQTIQSAS